MSKSISGLLPQVTFSILFALSLKPRHGYELIQQIERDSGGKIQLGAGALYGAIKRLGDNSLIEEIPFADDNDRRRCYRLTLKGWNVLEAELTYYESITQLAWQRRLGVHKNLGESLPSPTFNSPS